jgi:hypothetical protein
MPRLNARAAAEMLTLPAYEQLRILLEQKYPKQGAQPFRIPYYRPAITAIKAYYASGNDPAVLTQALNDFQSIGQQIRRTQLVRAITLFEGSQPSKRKITPTINHQMMVAIGNLEIRASPDFQANENEDHRILYVNCKQVALDADFAQRLAEVAQWIFSENGVDLSLDCFEILDLPAKKFLRFKRRRPRTIKLLKQNARVIETLWDAA